MKCWWFCPHFEFLTLVLYFSSQNAMVLVTLAMLCFHQKSHFIDKINQCNKACLFWHHKFCNKAGLVKIKQSDSLLTLRKWCQFWEDRINLSFVRISKNSIAGRTKQSCVNCKLCWDSRKDLLGDNWGEFPFILFPVQTIMTYGCSVWTGRANSCGVLRHLRRQKPSKLPCRSWNQKDRNVEGMELVSFLC